MFKIGDEVCHIPYNPYFGKGKIIGINIRPSHYKYKVRFEDFDDYMSDMDYHTIAEDTIQKVETQGENTMDNVEVGDTVTVTITGKVVGSYSGGFRIETNKLDCYFVDKSNITNVQKPVKPIAKGDRVFLGRCSGTVHEVMQGSLDHTGSIYLIVMWDNSGAPAVVRQDTVNRLM